MHLTGKVTEDEYQEFRKLTRAKLYWLRRLPGLMFAFWGSLFVLVVTLWVLAEHRHPGVGMLAAVWLVFVGILYARWLVARRLRQAEFSRFNAALPDQVELTDGALVRNGPGDAGDSTLWAQFDHWREGRRIILVYTTPGRWFAVLPVARLSDT